MKARVHAGVSHTGVNSLGILRMDHKDLVAITVNPRVRHPLIRMQAQVQVPIPMMNPMPLWLNMRVCSKYIVRFPCLMYHFCYEETEHRQIKPCYSGNRR